MSSHRRKTCDAASGRRQTPQHKHPHSRQHYDRSPAEHGRNRQSSRHRRRPASACTHRFPPQVQSRPSRASSFLRSAAPHRSLSGSPSHRNHSRQSSRDGPPRRLLRRLPPRAGRAMALNLPDDWGRKALETGAGKAPPRQLPSADAFLTGRVPAGRFVTSRLVFASDGPLYDSRTL